MPNPAARFGKVALQRSYTSTSSAWTPRATRVTVGDAGAVLGDEIGHESAG
jgi:hypothetical protein